MLDRGGQNAAGTPHSRERDHAFAVRLEIPPVDTGTSPIGAGEEPAVRQADDRKPARFIHGQQDQFAHTFAPGAVEPAKISFLTSATALCSISTRGPLPS